MRRQEIQLLARARRGDVLARCEVGRRYLLGINGFPRHVTTGIEYLTHPSLAQTTLGAEILCECLSLHELIERAQLPALELAALSENASAQYKLGVWLMLREGPSRIALKWLQAAARANHPMAERMRNALPRGALDGEIGDAIELIACITDAIDEDVVGLMRLVVRDALETADMQALTRGLRQLLAASRTEVEDIEDLVAEAVLAAERVGHRFSGLDAKRIETSLGACALNGDHHAAFLLGRALCGLPCGAFRPTDLVSGVNIRRGTALLLRAADAQCEEAWLHLYRLNANPRSSVANPEMARFFLEKAATLGQAEAQRRIGALQLREAHTLEQTEAAISWLYQAAAQHDDLALQLLRSLLLPVEGSEEQASSALDSLRQEDPLLATRLRLARSFGLTKLEALSMDPVAGVRPWGLVVVRNPFITQTRLAAPRAIPAVCTRALEELRRAAVQFAHARQDVSMAEGDLRRRALRQRRLMARHAIDPDLFFASATSDDLDARRVGPKWAFRQRQTLRRALAL